METTLLELKKYGIHKKNDFDYTIIQKELEKAKPYLKLPWDCLQNQNFDKKTDIIYNIDSFEELQESYELIMKFYPEISFGYLLNRWYNYKTSKAVEEIFCTYSIVDAIENSKDKTKDFKIFGTPFDLKLSVMPSSLYHLDPKIFNNRNLNKIKLIKWLYKDQSKEGRFHTKNRLFVICRSKESTENNKDAKEIKSHFSLIEEKIQSYLIYISILRKKDINLTFNELKFKINDKIHTIYSDAIIINK